MATLVGCPQEPEWHPEGDVWTHTLLVIDRARQRLDGLDHPRAVSVMLAAVAHDFGKPATTAVFGGRIRSLGHEEAGVAPTLTFLDRLNMHTLAGYDVRRQVTGLVAHHLKPGMWQKAPRVGDGAFRRLAARVELDLLARLSEADCLGRTGEFDCSAAAWFLERARALGVENRPPPPLLLGRHIVALGVPPGPRIGRILKAVYDAQIFMLGDILGGSGSAPGGIGQTRPCAAESGLRSGRGDVPPHRVRRSDRTAARGSADGAEVELQRLTHLACCGCWPPRVSRSGTADEPRRPARPLRSGVRAAMSAIRKPWFGAADGAVAASHRSAAVQVSKD